MPLLKRDLKKIKANNPQVTHIDLDNRGLFDEDIEMIVGLLLSNPYIISLNLSHNNIEENGAKALAKLKHLQRLDISENGIGDLGVKYLSKNEFIKYLDVSDNAITNVGAELLLKVAARYEELEIDGNNRIDKRLKEEVPKAVKNAKLQKTYLPSFFEKTSEELAKESTKKSRQATLTDITKTLKPVGKTFEDIFPPSFSVKVPWC